MSFEKRRIALRYWLLGRGFNKALEAMDFAESLHTGFRKDGVTPEFEHQVSIAHLARALPDLMHPEETISTALLHDVSEDYDVDPATLRARFGDLTGNAVWNMTKEYRGVKRDEKELFISMSNDPIASLDKGIDRDHNFSSMVGVFTPAKQLSYVDFAEENIIPMLKQARRNFPQQERAYEIIKHSLKNQMRLVRAMHAPKTED
jgi:(p)ppGpp synthase/HD superfamily hydrolase